MIVQNRDLGTETADKHRHVRHQPLLGQLVHHQQQLLGLAEGEDRDEHGAVGVKRIADQGGQAFLFRLATVVRRARVVPARGLQDEHVHVGGGETGRTRDGLVFKANIARVEKRRPLLLHEDAGGTDDVPGVVEAGVDLGARNDKGLFKATVHPARLGIVQLPMGEQRVLLHVELLTLAGHHVHGIVEHGAPDLTGGLGHEHGRPALTALDDRQAADVIVVGVGDEDGLGRVRRQRAKVRHRIKTRVLRVHAGIDHHARVAALQEVAVGADVSPARHVAKFHSK